MCGIGWTKSMTEEGLAFAGWKSLARWLISGKSGQRFCKWFVRKYWKQLLATDWGYEFHDWIQRNNHGENSDRTKVIVVEFRERDCVVVYGIGVSCTFVSRVASQSAQGDQLAEELIQLDLPYNAKRVFDTRNIIGMADFRVESALDRFEREEYERLWKSLGEVGDRIKSAGQQQQSGCSD
jgi:hypothetical protein